MVRQTNTASQDIRQICVEKFQEWWDIDELKDTLRFMTSQSVFDLLKNGKKDSENFLDNKQNVAELLFDSVGPRFLHKVLTEDNQEHKGRTKQFWVKIFETTIKKKFVGEKTAFEIFKKFGGMDITNLSEIENIKKSSRLLREFATILDLPPAVTEKTRSSQMESTITVESLVRYPPLYDYQFSTGRYLRKFLFGHATSKRTMVTIPTGAGKTRLVVEALVEWIAEGKPSDDEKIKKSSFILWIAPSKEICEQAVDSFEENYKHRGNPKQSLTIHRVWGKGGSLPDDVDTAEISENVGVSGVIVANIQSLTKIKNKDPELMNTLAENTGVIVVDEAHGITTNEHKSVLKSMGFDWSLRSTKAQPKPEFSTKGIVLIGLTATDFRGSGDNKATEELKRMFGSDNIFHPIIQDYEKENLMPIPIIDCPKFAPVGDEVRISGLNSFHYGGVIENYEWKITKNRLVDGSFFAKDPGRRKPTVIDTPDQKDVISIPFPDEGEYTIELKITDNFEKTATIKHKIIICPLDNIENLTSKEIQQLLYTNLMRRTILCNVYWKLVPVEGKTELTPEEQRHFDKFKDFSRSALKKKREELKRNESILEVISEMMTKYDRKKILLFGIDIQHARNLQIALTAKYKINAGMVTGETETQDRNRMIEEFKKEESKLSVLCNVGVLTQGFDAPKIDCVIVARPTHSNSLYTQMIGRGMRGKKSGGTVDVILVDMDDQWIIKDTEGKELENKNGFELYKDFWKDISQYRKEDHNIDKEKLEIEWNCIKCKKSAIGWSEIENIVKPQGDIVDYINAHTRGRNLLPPICKECRLAHNIPEDSKTIEEINREREKIKLEQKKQDKEEKSKNLIKIYTTLKKEYGHPPTKSMLYSNPLVDNVTKEIIEKYYENYDNFVKEQDDTIANNSVLITKLLDEYFDEFAEHHKIPSKYMMDRFGHYKLVDYEDCFGSFEKVQKAINPTLEKIQTIKEEYSIQKLEKDYVSIKEGIDHTPGYRDLLHSKLGIEHYLKKFRTISATIKFFENVESPEYIKKIIKEDYWVIRNKLGHAVSIFQFLKHGQFGSKINEYWKDHNDFLQWVGEKDSPITKSQSDLETLREKFIEDKVNAYKKDVRQTLRGIYEDNEFWYKEYFTTKHMFLKDMNKKIPKVDIEKQYEKFVHDILNPEEKKPRKKSHPPKQNTMTIGDTLTKKDKAKIGEKRKIFVVGKGVVDRKKKKPKTKKDSELKKIRDRLGRREITKAQYEKLKLEIIKKEYQATKRSKQQPKTPNKHLRTASTYRGKTCPKCGSKTKKYGTNISCSNPKCNWFKN